MSDPVVLIFSGGIDSTTLLYDLLSRKRDVRCLGFDYGQRHKKELHLARRIAAKLDVGYTIVDISNITPLLKGSSQTDASVEVPEGHYTAETMKATVVPNRNMIMLSIAAAGAISIGGHEIAYAAHAGDHAIYPDCRPEFVQQLQKTIALATGVPEFRLVTPYLDQTKANIVARGSALGVPYEMTWSCYKGDLVHCGKCGTCVERKEAFSLVGIPDPTSYVS